MSTIINAKPKYVIVLLQREMGYEGDLEWTTKGVASLKEAAKLTQNSDLVFRLESAKAEFECLLANKKNKNREAKEDQLRALCDELGYLPPMKPEDIDPDYS